MAERVNEKKITAIFEKVIYFLAVITCPNIYLFHLLNTNKGQNLYFSSFIYLGMILSVLSLIAFFVLKKLSNSKVALIYTPLGWILFWFINHVHYFFYGKIGSLPPIVGTLSVLLIIVVVMTYLLILLRKIEIDNAITNTWASVILLMFLYNFIPAIPFEGIFAEKPYDGKAYDLKTEFIVDATLPDPNIYWIHADGMMGFDAVEKYCGYSQTEFRNSLENKGFLLNPMATLNAGYTALATPALLSPAFYDSYLADKIPELKGVNANSQKTEMYKCTRKDGFQLYDIYDKEELLKAFEQAGYRNYTFFNPIFGIAPMDLHRNTADSDLLIKSNYFDKVVILADIFKENNRILYEILKRIPYEKIEGTEFPEYEDVVDSIVPIDAVETKARLFVRSLAEALDIKESTFAYLAMDTPHAIYRYDENGKISNYVKEQNFEMSQYDAAMVSSLELYYQQHKYTAKILDRSVDLIIEKDPDAIIIIQADHGNHIFSHDWMKEHGYSEEQMREIWFSTMSAVRVPEKYGKLTEPLEPLNISRWLVNNFVGENYEYIN